MTTSSAESNYRGRLTNPESEFKMAKAYYTKEDRFKSATEMVNYDPDTGAFTYKRDSRPCGIPDRAGNMTMYVPGKGQINLDELAWFIVYDFVAEAVEHVDGDKYDNSRNNLRLGIRRLNTRATPKNNTSGILGVTFQASTGKWVARVTINKRQTYIGSFDTKEGAAAAVQAARDSI